MVMDVKIKSRVMETPAASPDLAFTHFTSSLSFETDPSDVYFDLKNGEDGFVVVDARSPEAFAEAHIPGAINLPHRTINKHSTAHLPKDKVIVTYCFTPPATPRPKQQPG